MAPKFVYQNVLDIRHSKVEAIEIQLSRVEKILADLENRNAALKNLKLRLLSEMQVQMQGELDIHQLDMLRSNVIIVDGGIVRVEKEIEEARRTRQQVLNSLISAKQDEETLEVLKEKAVEKFNDEMKRIENVQQDDIYISLAFKQSQQGVRYG